MRRTFEDRLKNISEILRQISSAALKLSMKKYEECERWRQQEWDDHFPKFILAFYYKTHAKSHVFAQRCNLLGDLHFAEQVSPSCSLRNFLRSRNKIASNKMKARYQLAANSDRFTQHKKGLSPKLQRNWEGSCCVIKKLNDVVYRIQKYNSPESETKDCAPRTTSTLLSGRQYYELQQHTQNCASYSTTLVTLPSIGKNLLLNDRRTFEPHSRSEEYSFINHEKFSPKLVLVQVRDIQ